MLAFDSPLKPAEVFTVIRAHSNKQDTIFLVGGVVRDLLLHRPIHDIDLVMGGDVRSLAKKVANSLDGDFFMLDSERDTARVLYTVPEGERLVIDFASFRGDTLEEDLLARDFTVNAMALSLDDPDRRIDPLKGAEDLRAGLLRACRPDAFKQDALRVLRGVRFALDLDCKIVPETWQWMEDAAPALQEVSAERKRDEIFRILGGGKISSAFRLLDQVGALAFLSPDSKGNDGLSGPSPYRVEHFERTLEKLQRLEELLGGWGKEPVLGSVQNRTFEAAELQLGRFRDRVQDYLDSEVSSGRRTRELLLLAAWVSGSAGLQGEKVERGNICAAQPKMALAGEVASDYGRTFVLSQVETKRLERMLACQPLLQYLFELGEDLSPKDIYCYFRNSGEAGIDLTFLAMADFLAAYRADLPLDVWLKKLATVDRIWEAWWFQRLKVVDPPRVLTGNDFQDHFGIPAGLVIGLGLEAVREAQVEGKIATKEDAFNFLKKWMGNRKYQSSR